MRLRGFIVATKRYIEIARAWQLNRLLCCRRSGKQEREGPRVETSLKTALKRLKIIASDEPSVLLRAAYIPLLLELERHGEGVEGDAFDCDTDLYACYWLVHIPSQHPSSVTIQSKL
jgi:hypothetical protein